MSTSLPFDPDFEVEITGTGVVTGFTPPGTDRTALLEALALNEKILNGTHPDVEVDEAAVQDTIDTLLEQLHAIQR